jgi:hypothetical protein
MVTIKINDNNINDNNNDDNDNDAIATPLT